MPPARMGVVWEMGTQGRASMLCGLKEYHSGRHEGWVGRGEAVLTLNWTDARPIRIDQIPTHEA